MTVQMYSTRLAMRSRSANDQPYDDNLKLAPGEGWNIAIVLFAGVGLLWFLGWLLTL